VSNAVIFISQHRSLTPTRLTRCGLVEQQYLGLAQQCPCNAQPHSLPARQLVAVIADACVVSIRERHDEVVRVGLSSQSDQAEG
jgi:hypothetical protein